MPPYTVWTDHLNKSELKLGIRGIEWKNFMNECLMATQIKKVEFFSDHQLNPNAVMDIRHQRVKKCARTSPVQQAQIPRKLLQDENSKKLLCVKEEKLISKEIVKLKQILESYQTLTRGNLETDEKRKPLQQLPKINDRVIKLRVSQVSRQYQMEKTMHVRISEKIVEKNNFEGTIFEKESLHSKKDKMPLRADEKNCEEIFAKFSEEKEYEDKDMSEAEVKPVLQFLEVMNQRQLKRAWQKWRLYRQRQRNRKIEKKVYVDKIDAFLRKLQNSGTETKVKVRTTSCKQEGKTLKLPRRAKTAVDDEDRKAKLKKFMEEVKMSQMEVFQRLRCNKVTEVKTFPNPKFLSQMEERREERMRRWKEIQERKQRIEKEREENRKREEEEKKQKTEQEKKKRIEVLKEKRSAEKERKEALKAKKEKLRRDSMLANDHCRKFLLRCYGLRPWLKLIRLKDAQYKQAEEFHRRKLLRMFVLWRIAIREQADEKRKKAEQLYNRNLVKRCWWSWAEFRVENISKEQAASDWNDFKVTEKLFRNWVWFTDSEKSEYFNKRDMAESYYKRKLKMKCLGKLKSYPEYEKKRRETEIRKLKWRQRVKEILPDYRPFEIMEEH